ncbi:MAG: RidA family protein [Burkholderiaceae bacterium]|nr:RidA family protein [Burkholderiaceae bacterium]
MKQTIVCPNAPAAVGTYSVAVKAGNTIYCSGQIGIDPRGGNLLMGFEAQCRQAFRNVFAVLESAGATPNDIVRQTIYLTDLSNFATVNRIMSEIFKAPYPARSCVQISGLPKGALVEIEATAVIS